MALERPALVVARHDVPRKAEAGPICKLFDAIEANIDGIALGLEVDVKVFSG